MPSRILHLAAAKLLLDESRTEDADRFLFGSLLPDAGERVSAHFRIPVDGGKRITMSLGNFRDRFSEQMEDPLYLGYYLHLVQDIVFRKLFYLDRGWQPDSPEKIARLYNDYRILNAWAIEKYGLQESIAVPHGYDGESIHAVSAFMLPQFLFELHKDFAAPPTDGECIYYTKDIAEEFLTESVRLCRLETEALREGKSVVDEYAWAWYADKK